MDGLSFFRRPFDTKTVTALRRIFIFISGSSLSPFPPRTDFNGRITLYPLTLLAIIHLVSGLIAFAVNRISYVWEQDFIFRTKIILLQRDVQYIPDAVFCITNVTNAINVTVAYKDNDLDYRVFVLKDPSMPPGYKIESMCDYKVYDTMVVFWMKNEITKLRPRDTFTRAIGLGISGNVRGSWRYDWTGIERGLQGCLSF